MNYGLYVKNPRGEIIIDGVSNISQILATEEDAINGYEGHLWDTTAYSNSLNLTLITSIRNNWASNWVRRYDKDKIYIFNRLWYTLDPSPNFKVALSLVGTGASNIISEEPYGFQIVGNKSNEIINANSRTLRWVASDFFTAPANTITGAFDNWVWGPFSSDISYFNFKTPPFVFLSPITYVSIEDGTDYSYFAFVWYVSTEKFYFGTYLLQSDKFETILSETPYQVILLSLD